MKKDQYAIIWINRMVAEVGVKETRKILLFNVTKSEYFHQSIHWITSAWERLNEINPS